MSYKLNDILNSLTTKLAELVTAGTVEAVVGRVINPLTEVNLPVVAILATRGRRLGGPEGSRDWSVAVEIALAVRQGEDAKGKQLRILTAEIDAKLEEWEASGTGGGVIANYEFNDWYHPKAKDALSPVGCVFSFDLKIEGPLKF